MILWENETYFAEKDGDYVNIVAKRTRRLVQKVKLEAYEAIIKGVKPNE